MYQIKTEGTKVEISLHIGADEWENGVESVFQANKNKFSVEGFRKGKAPRKVIEKTYGDNVFFEDTVDFFLNKVMNEVLEKNPELEPVVMPTTQFESYSISDGLKMKILFDIVPDFTLGKYTGLEVKVYSTEVTEHDIEHRIHHLLEDNAKFETVDRAAKDGDVAVIDFVGFLNGVEFEGGSASDYSLELGSHSFVDNFEEQLVGHKAGEKVDVKVTFPQEYGAENLAGKQVSFDVTIKEVKEKHLPELNDKFIADATEFETLQEYRKDVTAHIQDMKQKNQREDFIHGIREQLVKNTQIDIPEAMVENSVHNDIHRMEHALEAYKISLEDYLRSTGCQSVEDYAKLLKERTLRSIKLRYILRKIVEEQHIEVTADELAAATKGMTKHEDVVKKENELTLEKIDEFLLANNKMKVVGDNEDLDA